MKQFISMRSLLSFALLWLIASTLVSSLQTSIQGLLEAPFLPLAIFGMALAYLLGFSNWKALRSWIFIVSFSPLLILLEASHSWSAIWQILSHLPALLFSLLIALVTRQSLDLSFFQIQLAEILRNIEVLLKVITSGNKNESLTMIELFWDIPLYLVCAWSGWWSRCRCVIEKPRQLHQPSS